MPHGVGDGRALARGGKNVVARIAAGIAGLALPVLASATLTVTPLTWNVVGLDSNSPATGPQHFPVGARVCSTSNATNVSVSLVWDSANAYVNERPGSLTTLAFPSIAANACVDAYFEVEVTRNPAAFDTARRYHITASDGVETASTPTPRELYVEHLISQNRNAITNIKVDGVPVPAGGSIGLVVGNTYTIELDGGTATQGYNQFQSFINFSNAIFQVLSVATTYSADNSPYVPGPAPLVNDKLYADACGWENRPGSPNYRSCVGGDYKAGGSNVSTIYTIRIIGGGGTSQALSSLLYDFSGSSFHYNADYGVRGVIANIVDPTTLGFSQAFTPATSVAGGTSTLSFTITNPNAAPVSALGFVDTLPILAGGQMVVASPATFSTQGCGTPTFAPTAGATSLAVSNVTLPAHGSCTLNVTVSVPASPTSGSYVNTSGDLIVGGLDIGRNSTAALGLTNVAAPTNMCGLTLARWTMEPAAGATVPPAPSFKATDVASAAATAGAGVTSTIDTTIGNPVNAWSLNGFATGASLVTGNGDYVQFAVDTTNYSAITFSFDARLDSSLHGPKSLQLFSSTDGTTFSAYGSVIAPTAGFASYGPAVTGANAAGVTYFRIYGYNAGNNGADADLFLDNVKVGGCQTAQAQTITKAFSPASIAVGGTSTLTFTIANPNTAPITGVAFSDALPSGLQVAATPNAASTCGGTFTPAAGDATLSFGQPSGATIAASSSCTVKVDVTATIAGSKTNVTGFVSSAEGGTNAGGGGSAAATLQVIAPPAIAAAFAPESAQVNGSSVLTFTLTNPNAAGALSSVSFAANYPANLVNGSGIGTSCGGSVVAAPGGASVSLSGGSIAAASTCTISVPVTSSVAGSYTVATNNVSDAIGGSGNSASATVSFTPPQPGIAMLKQVATSASGPWKPFVTAAPGAPLYYRFTVENTGDAPFASFGVTDPTLLAAGVDPATCLWQTSNSPSTLPALPVATATIDPTATCVLGPVTVALGGHGNTANGHGVYNGTMYDSVASSADYVGAIPGFSLVKEVATNVDGPFGTAIAAAPGSDVFYRLTLVNSGALDLTGVGVVDNLLDTSSCTFTDPLVVGDATVCTVGPVTAGQPVGTVVTNTAHGIAQSGGTGYATPDASASYTVASSGADLAVTNTDGLTTLYAGSSTQYTVTVTNSGPDGVANATLVDNAPAAMNFVAWNCAVTAAGSGGGVTTACGSAGGTGDVDVQLTLAPGAVITLQIAANVAANASGSITNRAAVSAPVGTFDPVAGNDSADDTDMVSNSADVMASIDDGVTSVAANGTTTYVITVTNNGPAASVGGLLHDAAAAGLEKAGVACGPAPGNCVTPPTIAELEAGFVLPTLRVSETYQLAVSTQVSGSGSVTSTATVAGGADPNAGNDSASDTDVVNAPPPVPPVIVTSAGSASWTQGSPAAPVAIDPGITVTDADSATQASAVVSITGNFHVAEDVLAFTNTSASTFGNIVGSYNAATGVLTLTSSAASATLAQWRNALGAVTYTDTAATPNTATRTVSFSVNDGALSSNVATRQVTFAPPPPTSVDISVSVDDGVASVVSGNATTYHVVVANNGPASVTGVVLTDPAAVGLAKTGVACAGASQCVTPPAITELEAGVALPALAAGQTYALEVMANVTAAAGGNVSNVASVAVPAGYADTDATNDVASDSDAVTAPLPPPPGNADLGIGLTASPTSVSAGGKVTFTLTVQNNGPVDVANATLTDVAPAGVTFGNWTCAVTTPGMGALVTACGAASGSGNVNTRLTLDNGAVVTYTIAATVAANASGNVVNSASVNVPAGVNDPASANDSASANVTVTAAPPAPPPPTNVQSIPTLSEWSLMLLALLMFGAAVRSLRSRMPRG